MVFLEFSVNLFGWYLCVQGGSGFFPSVKKGGLSWGACGEGVGLFVFSGRSKACNQHMASSTDEGPVLIVPTVR